jgi:hypothetical protein
MTQVVLLSVLFLEPVDTDLSQVFSDFKMTPNDLTNLARKRRNINLNDESNQRRKRALSTYDFYNTDPVWMKYIIVSLIVFKYFLKNE